MRGIAFLFFLATIFAAACHGADLGISSQVHPLRPRSGAGGHYIPGVSCWSWRLGVEAHNIIDWKTIPQECEGYVGNYMLGHQYRQDSKAVANEALHYAQSLKLRRDGKDIWIFDIDETTLSNLPYYAQHGFGAEPFDSVSFNKWVNRGIGPALPESLRLYQKLLSLGIKVAFITGRGEERREVTAKNLKHAGYHSWAMLILKDSSFSGKTAVTYKSAQRKKIEEKGYRIIGNIGDQWSDLLGTNTGNRTFKLPDPMYYIS